MRVLIVTQYFWPESFRINDLAHGLRDRGHDVTVLTGLPNYPDGRFFAGYGWFSRGEDYDGVRVVRVPMFARGKSQGLRLLLNYASFALSASFFGPFRCRGKFDVIFAFEPSPITVGIPASVMKRFKRAPLLFWVQDLWPETLTATGAVRSPWILRRIGNLVRRIYRRCDKVLVQSPGFVPHVQWQGVPDEKIEYFPNWAEEFFQPVSLPDDAPERAEMPNGFRILFAGNIGVSQSFETILAAAEKTKCNSQIQWVVLGDGREKENVEQQIEERGLSETVHLLGRRPVETMPGYFAAADALLCTLKREPIFSLTIPSKLQSYLACGKPILAALDGVGATIVAESHSGLTGPAEDAAALAENAVRLFEMSQPERDALGKAGRDYFQQHFERERLLDRLET
ncbi:MAG: glycosyltransferase family 4 protein, partial [Planctomycetes bacterium]|nr:glycosyltransferase family 4 protein [Planctomycetota bacterium]